MTVISPVQEEGHQYTEPLLNDGDSYSLRPFDQDDILPTEDYHRPPRLSRYLKSAFIWCKKRQKQREHVITPVLEPFQTVPLALMAKYAPTPLKQMVGFAIASGLWLLCFGILIARGNSTAPVPGFGSPRRLSCTSSPWPSDGKSCGLDGTNCLPFGDATFAFRCPPDCGRVEVLEPSFVGDQVVQYRLWVIGGPTALDTDGNDAALYRGDSFICGAAIHAGVIDNALGGCGVLSLNGAKDAFPSTERYGVTSIGFNSSFPMSFSVEQLHEPQSQCYDPRWATLAISVLLTLGLSLFTTSAPLFYFCTFTVVFFQVALISDAPDFQEYLSVVQSAFSRFLPAIFFAFTIFRFCAAKTLVGLEAQIEKTILWLGGCWFGALENYTLDKLPLQRLTPRDLSQLGAVTVLIVVVALIAVAAIGQAWAFWQDGRFKLYATLYALLAGGLLILAQVPGLNLRIHHYILALLLLPGTAIQTRCSLLFQGFLVGLFINGVARWGFASILETDNFLASKGPIGSAMPDVPPPLIEGANITFAFPNVTQEWDGISMVVNDVERARWPGIHEIPTFLWTRTRDEPLFFRFNYFRMEFMKGFLQGDSTDPGTWQRDGSWVTRNDTV